MKKKLYNEKAAFLRSKFHKNYLKLMNVVESIEPEVLNPEMLEYLEKNYFSKSKAVSFIANHTNSHDIPVAAKAVKEHFYVMIAKEGLNIIQKIGFILNGPIWVERKGKNSKESKKQAQLKLIEMQKHGYSTLVYPEASWNTKENKFMNKLYEGAVRASLETDVDIIPLVFEYHENKCYVKIGKPYKVNKNVDTRTQSDELRDIMTTLRVNILEEINLLEPMKEIYKKIEFIVDNWYELSDEKYHDIILLRNELQNCKSNIKKEFVEKIEKNWKDCPGLDREFEATCIYKDGDSPDEVFKHLEIIKNNPKAAFLFQDGLTGYKK